MTLLPAATARIDALVARAQAQGQAPSVILGVVRGGELVHVAAAGRSPEPTPDTQYRIGSISKTLTATVVMRLRDEGRLSLDDPLAEHLPDVPVGRATVRQLLGHVSGLQREPELAPHGGPGEAAWWERTPGGSVDTLLGHLRTDMLVYPPYQVPHYSNLAYGLLGALISRITGEAWSDAIDRRLLTPLGMTRTTYQCEEPYARGYVVHPWHGTLREEPRHDSGAMAPAGQLWSTVTDMATWLGFLADPAPEVIDPATVAEMTTTVNFADPHSWSAGYGLGLYLTRRGDRVLVGHSGSMPGYLAMVLVHRPSGIGAVAFCNSYNAPVSLGGLCGEAIETVLDSQPAPHPTWQPAATAPPAEVAPLCGRWWFMGQEYQAAWHPDAKELVVRQVAAPQAVPWRFVAEGTDRWRCRSGFNNGELLTVHRTGDGEVAELEIATFRFTRDPMPKI